MRMSVLMNNPPWFKS